MGRVVLREVDPAFGLRAAGAVDVGGCEAGGCGCVVGSVCGGGSVFLLVGNGNGGEDVGVRAEVAELDAAVERHCVGEIGSEVR